MYVDVEKKMKFCSLSSTVLLYVFTCIMYVRHSILPKEGTVMCTASQKGYTAPQLLKKKYALRR